MSDNSLCDCPEHLIGQPEFCLASKPSASIPPTQEECDNCGQLFNRGYLSAYADDFTDLRNGKVLLCVACGKEWREAWRTVVRWTRSQSERAFLAWLSSLGKRVKA